MKKGLALPLAGIIMLVVSITVVYVMAQGDSTFTRRIIFSGEIAASNLNEIEALRKMLPESINATVQRAVYEMAQIGGGESLWAPAIVDVNVVRDNLHERITQLLPLGIKDGNFNREINWRLPVFEISESENYIDITGYQSFDLTDELIDSEANINITFDETVESSYFELANIGLSLFTDTDYQNIINSNAEATTRATQLQSKLASDYPHLNFEVVATSTIVLDITIEDPDCLCPIKPDEPVNILTEGPYDTLKLIFSINIPERIIIPEKVNPVYLYVGWNYVMTPFINNITVQDAWISEMDKIEIIDCDMFPYCRGTAPFDYILTPEMMFYVHVTADCMWTGDY